MKPVIKISVWGDKNAKKFDIGTVRFDMNYEKIVKPESKIKVIQALLCFLKKWKVFEV